MTEPSIIEQNVRKSLVGPLNMYSSGERQPNFFFKKKVPTKKTYRNWNWWNGAILFSCHCNQRDLRCCKKTSSLCTKNIFSLTALLLYCSHGTRRLGSSWGPPPLLPPPPTPTSPPPFPSPSPLFIFPNFCGFFFKKISCWRTLSGKSAVLLSFNVGSMSSSSSSPPRHRKKEEDRTELRLDYQKHLCGGERESAASRLQNCSRRTTPPSLVSR